MNRNQAYTSGVWRGFCIGISLALLGLNIAYDHTVWAVWWTVLLFVNAGLAVNSYRAAVRKDRLTLEYDRHTQDLHGWRRMIEGDIAYAEREAKRAG